MDDSELYVGKFKKNQRNGEGILKTNEHLVAGTFTGGEFSLPKDDPSQTKGNFNTPILGKVENQTTNLSKKGFRI